MFDMRYKSMKPIRNELGEVQTLNSHFGLRDMPGNSDISLKPKFGKCMTLDWVYTPVAEATGELYR